MWCMPSSFIAKRNSMHLARRPQVPPSRRAIIDPVQDGSLIPRFGRARRDPALAVLEGFHPLKHALRFGAEILEVLSPDAQALERLALELAPAERERMLDLAREIDRRAFDQLAPLAPSTGVMAL